MVNGSGQNPPSNADTAAASPDSTRVCFAPTGQLFGTGADERLILTFGSRNAGPLRYRPAFSADLTPWQIGSPLSISAILTNEGATRAGFQTADPLGGNRRFGRILVEYLPRP